MNAPICSCLTYLGHNNGGLIVGEEEGVIFISLLHILIVTQSCPKVPNMSKSGQPFKPQSNCELWWDFLSPALRSQHFELPDMQEAALYDLTWNHRRKCCALVSFIGYVSFFKHCFQPKSYRVAFILIVRRFLKSNNLTWSGSPFWAKNVKEVELACFTSTSISTISLYSQVLVGKKEKKKRNKEKEKLHPPSLSPLYRNNRAIASSRAFAVHLV